MNKLQMKQAQMHNAILNTLEVYGYASMHYIEAVRLLILSDKRCINNGSTVTVSNTSVTIEYHPKREFNFIDNRVNSLYRK